MLPLKLKIGEPVSQIKNYFSGLETHPDPGIAHIARRFALRCLTLEAQYQSAINGHTDWKQSTNYICDSLYSEIDILTNQLYQSGSLLNKKAQQDVSTLKHHNAKFVDYRNDSETILNNLFKIQNSQKTRTIPSDFSLSQNYPNPFAEGITS